MPDYRGSNRRATGGATDFEEGSKCLTRGNGRQNRWAGAYRNAVRVSKWASNKHFSETFVKKRSRESGSGNDPVLADLPPQAHATQPKAPGRLGPVPPGLIQGLDDPLALT